MYASIKRTLQYQYIMISIKGFLLNYTNWYRFLPCSICQSEQFPPLLLIQRFVIPRRYRENQLCIKMVIYSLPYDQSFPFHV